MHIGANLASACAEGALDDLWNNWLSIPFWDRRYLSLFTLVWTFLAVSKATALALAVPLAGLAPALPTGFLPLAAARALAESLASTDWGFLPAPSFFFRSLAFGLVTGFFRAGFLAAAAAGFLAAPAAVAGFLAGAAAFLGAAAAAGLAAAGASFLAAAGAAAAAFFCSGFLSPGFAIITN